MNQQPILTISLFLTILCSVYSQQLSLETPKSITFEELSSYNRWRSQNKRNYLNDYEQLFRQLTFFHNLRKVKEHNSNPNNTYTIDTNLFADMTDEEFSQSILNDGLSETSDDIDNLESEQTTTFNTVPSEETPAPIAVSIDWRTKGATFASIALMDSHNFIKNGSLLDLSEQQILDCTSKKQGCQGGQTYSALAYASKYGVVENSVYPYTVVKGKCQVSSPITNGYKPNVIEKTGTTDYDLKKALNKSPVVAYVDARKFKSYHSGLFNGCNPESLKLTHAVLVVGYGTSGNWVIKNSWGTRWGINGYMRLAAGDTCGLLRWNKYIIAS